MNYRSEWLNACFGKTDKAESILAIFKSGREVNYTMSIFNSLVTDPAIKEIVSLETGEVLFERS